MAQEEKDIKEQLKHMVSTFMFSERSMRSQHHMKTVLNNPECIQDSKKVFDQLDNDEEIFRYLNTKLFAWTAVLSDDLTECFELFADILARLDRLEKKNGIDNDNDDSDFINGGF